MILRIKHFISLAPLLAVALILSACGTADVQPTNTVAAEPSATTAPPTSTAAPPTATDTPPLPTVTVAATAATVSADIVFVHNGHVALVNADGSGLRDLLDSGAISQPHWSPDKSKIVYVKNSGSDAALFVTDTAGKSYALPHQAGMGDAEPGWSPDGNTIVFTRGADKNGDGRIDGADNSEVWLVDAAGANPRRLADGFDAAWSPDGKLIAFATAGQNSENNTIDMINTQGQNRWSPVKIGQVPQDTSTVNPDAQFNAETNYLRYPVWSPDGKSIAFNAFGHSGLIVTASAKGENPTMIDFSYEGGYRRVYWSPDSANLAYENLPASGINQVVLRDLGSKKQTVFGSPQTGESADSPTWAPDSARVAFIQNAQTTDTGFASGSLVVASANEQPKIIVDAAAADPDWR